MATTATPNAVAALSRASWSASHGQPARRLPIKDVSESLVIVFDFGPVAAAVSSPAVSIFIDRDKGTDVAPLLMLAGSAYVNPNNAAQVLQPITGGVADNDYGFRCVVTPPGSESLVLTAILPVRNIPGFYTPTTSAPVVQWDDSLTWNDSSTWIET